LAKTLSISRKPVKLIDNAFAQTAGIKTAQLRLLRCLLQLIINSWSLAIVNSVKAIKQDLLFLNHIFNNDVEGLIKKVLSRFRLK